jgi:Flp pilus assembly protein TadD
MIPATREEQKKEAFRLFEDGRYHESLRVCQVLLEEGKDSAIEVLAATNLFSTGRLEDAEVSFRDLARKMPDSSYVHSYLAKVLEASGDEGAIAEFATAVHLDPTNQDALRSYASYLLGHQDYRGALSVLRRLVQIGKKPADVRNLMRALIEVGDADEALAANAVLGEGAQTSHEYIDALARTRNYRAAAEAAHEVWRQTKDPAVLRKYLDALSRYDTPSSLDAYASHINDSPTSDILFDYILLQKSNGNFGAALDATRALLSTSSDPIQRLCECDLLAETGQDEKALAAYERLVKEELAAKNDLEQLRFIISRYRVFLRKQPDPARAKRRFLDLVSTDVNVASLLETARFFQDLGETSEAGSWYYRAYRADFLVGGLEYARFLSSQGEDRECEKVMLYILTNVKKAADLTRVAREIVDEKGRMSRMKRLMEHLIRRLGERRSALSSDGLELLAMAFFITATNALEEKDYAGCKYFCLSGMDILPTPPRALRLEDFLQLIQACKEQSIADQPIMHPRLAPDKADTVSLSPALADQLDLSDPETKIVEFLRTHRKASEMDLRKVLGTRRVVGIVNILMQKAAAQGIFLIDKKGVGEEGEIYEYTGT